MDLCWISLQSKGVSRVFSNTAVQKHQFFSTQLSLWSNSQIRMWLVGVTTMTSYDKPKQHIKKQRHHFADKGPYSQSYGFFSSHVWMWELNHKEVWALKNRWFWTVFLEKTLESHLDSKEIKPVNPKGKETNPEYSLEELMLKLQYFGHLMWRADSLEKTLMLGKTEGKRSG